MRCRIRVKGGCAEDAARSSAAVSKPDDLLRRSIMDLQRQILSDRTALDASLRTNVAGSVWIFEAADGFRNYLLRQPEHYLWQENHERDRDQENAIDRQRGAQGLRKSHPHEFRRHEQDEPVWRRDQPECKGGDE